MTSENPKSPGAGGCARRGCIGCGIAALILLFIPVVLLLITRAGGRPEPLPEKRHFTRQLPGMATDADARRSGTVEAVPGEGPMQQGSAGVTAGEGGPASTSPNAAGAGPLEAPEALDPTTLDARELPGLARADEPVRVVLDLSMGSFIIEPGEPGEPLAVDADFDARTFELEERWDEASRTYTLRFHAKGGWLGLLRSRHKGRNEVRLALPPGYPLRLEGEVGAGESRIELGGLSLAEVDLEIGAGDHEISFRRPLSQPLDRLRIDGSYGELEIDRIGNASPRRARFSHSAGACTVDLSGAWANDAEVEVKCGFGDCRVRLPDDDEAAVDLERAHMAMGERRLRIEGTPNLQGLPKIELSASSSAGELSVD